MKPKNFARRVAQRQEDAETRQGVYDKLSLKDKLTLIDSRPGDSKRERARIEAAIEAGASDK